MRQGHRPKFETHRLYKIPRTPSATKIVMVTQAGKGCISMESDTPIPQIFSKPRNWAHTVLETVTNFCTVIELEMGHIFTLLTTP